MVVVKYVKKMVEKHAVNVKMDSNSWWIKRVVKRVSGR